MERREKNGSGKFPLTGKPNCDTVLPPYEKIPPVFGES